MRTNPLAIVCIFFCLGIWAAKFVYSPLSFIYISCVLFLSTALFSLKKQLLFSLSLSIAIFLAGFLHLQNAQIYPVSRILHFVSDNSQNVYLIGRIVSNPETSQTFYRSQKTSFTFRVSDLKAESAKPSAASPQGDPRKGIASPPSAARNDEKGWQAVEGLIKVTLYGERMVGYGDELLLQGNLSRPPGLRNPGGFDYRAYLVNHNIFGLLKVKEKDIFLEIASSPSGRLRSRPSAPRNAHNGQKVLLVKTGTI